MQALASQGMGPKFLAFVDKKGRPVWCVIIQVLFGLLAFINEADAGEDFFTWLLALSGIANFFIWGSINLSHIRFRQAWKYNGRDVDELPYRAQAGVIGSWCGLGLCVLCIMASFYTAVIPLDAAAFFEAYLAGPLILALYVLWKCYTRHWEMLVPISKMDVTSGMRQNIDELRAIASEGRMEKTWGNLPKRVMRNLF